MLGGESKSVVTVLALVWHIVTEGMNSAVLFKCFFLFCSVITVLTLQFLSGVFIGMLG